MDHDAARMTPAQEKANTRMHLWDLARDTGLFIAAVVRYSANILHYAFCCDCLALCPFLPAFFVNGVRLLSP